MADAVRTEPVSAKLAKNIAGLRGKKKNGAGRQLTKVPYIQLVRNKKIGFESWIGYTLRWRLVEAATPETLSPTFLTSCRCSETTKLDRFG